MSSCILKNCEEEDYENGFCAKHYNEIIKRVGSDINKGDTNNLKEEYSGQEKEELSTKTQFFLLSLLTHIDKFTNSLVVSFSNFFNLNKNETAEVYRQMSNKLINKKENKKAIPFLKKVVELNQDDADSTFELGSAYLSEGLHEKAISCFEEAINLNPDNYKYHSKIGIIYEQNELWDKAIVSYQKAIKIDPDDSEVHYRLGVIYDNVENFKDSIASFRKAIELNPKQANYYHSLGFAYESLDQHKEAVKCYKRAISLQQTSV